MKRFFNNVKIRINVGIPGQKAGILTDKNILGFHVMCICVHTTYE